MKDYTSSALRVYLENSPIFLGCGWIAIESSGTCPPPPPREHFFSKSTCKWLAFSGALATQVENAVEIRSKEIQRSLKAALAFYYCNIFYLSILEIGNTNPKSQVGTISERC